MTLTLQYKNKHLKVIVIGHSNHDENKLACYFKAGALGYINISATISEWLQSIAEVNNDDYFMRLTNEPYEVFRKSSEHSTQYDFTQHEYGIVQRIMDGHNHPSVALNITVEQYQYKRSLILRKFRVKNHLEVTKLALKQGLFIQGKTACKT